MVIQDMALMAHLLRRAGFGATRGELDEYAAKGYEATLDELLDFDEPQTMSDYLVRRYHHEYSAMMDVKSPQAVWLYRMISTTAPLQEKVALFWHGIFATGYNGKVVQGKVLMDQIRMLRHFGLGSYKTLLVELSKDPAMIGWLDNHHNHKGAINENFGRELLELFSMGVGNYTEDDIKECARAFTGWTVANTEYVDIRVQRDSIWPYGRVAWHFEYRPEDHDEGEKEFLGEKGNFNGEDIIAIICKQPATARFISRHMYSFFVADEPPVPQWPYVPPRDPEAIEVLSQAYFDSHYDIRSMLRVLFSSRFFKSEDCRHAKVKSPAEFVAGTLRLSGEFQRPMHEMLDRNFQMIYMGQQLTNPPSVEGWHTGTEWVDTGNLVERLNFSSEQLGDIDKPGVKAMTERIVAGGGGELSPEQMVDGCLAELGALSVSEETRATLVEFASDRGDIGNGDPGKQARRRVADMLQMVSATREFQQA